MLRYLAGEPIYPIGYVQHKNPVGGKKKVKAIPENSLMQQLRHNHSMIKA